MAALPEILAPAGDDDSLAAALAAGADAVYLGLDGGMNARARAANFSVERLPALADQVHRAGARLYVTLNTLVFEHELPVVESYVRACAEAGVDALIVQDPAVALLARAVAPTLEVHASTQMTISSPEGARFAARLGVTRIVVPRELSVDEIGRFAAACSVPLEVFVHGALCMSWSGQCLTSEAWGGRSANRGQCAQSCRLPYGLVVDGAPRDTGDLRYLLSPMDLAGLDAIPALAETGVASLKIEGRLKGPAYVWSAVKAYQRARAGDGSARDEDLRRMAATYSRGFSPGFLQGADHTALVPGRFPKHRGLLVGRVAAVSGERVRVERGATHGLAVASEVVPGMGVGFDTGRPEAEEPGGRVYAVDGDWIVLGEAPRGVSVGDRVFVSSDPRVQKEVDAAPPPTGRVPVDVVVTGRDGEPLTAAFTARGVTVSASTASPLRPATGRGLDEALLADKLLAFGGTPFRAGTVDAAGLAAGLHVAPGALKELRRSLVGALEERWLAAFRHPVDPRAAAPRVHADAAAVPLPPGDDGPARIVPLVRTQAQLEVVHALGFPEVELDFMERVGLGRAVAWARERGLRVTIATTRVQKPGEAGLDDHARRLRPDAVLVRHWGGLETFAAADPAERPVVHGDFSLNVTNSVTARHLLAIGCATVTAAHDLDERQLFALLSAVPADRVTVVVHHHVPTFHTEHCVYAHTLSATGKDFRTCGRPCESHRVALRDRDGRDHPVVVDVGCRNTVFDARAQCAASVAPKLVAAGVKRLRVELVWEDADTARAVLSAWRDLVAGAIGPAQLLERVRVREQFGVTRGTMRVLSEPAGAR
jgi:putative protease